MTDSTERLRRANAALTTFDPAPDASPAALITALLDLIAATDNVPGALTTAIVDHATHTVEERPGTGANSNQEAVLDQTYATIAGNIIAALLYEAHSLDQTTPHAIRLIADSALNDHLAAEHQID
ncbi:hypothetical protein [Spirillospora sp. CA-128828]|uniref:hypothetical protein n=1 Tax=Spirillospora sp. CA-128828 TaxID=3240033 RepID=UPI003D8B34CB